LIAGPLPAQKKVRKLMEALLFWLLILIESVLATCVLVFFGEIAAAVVTLWRDRVLHVKPDTRERIAVLVPAHNEGSGLLPTLVDVKSQLQPGDRLVVVADNCSDDTADVALAAGAEVVKRTDPVKHGKGYALECGVSHLRADPRKVIIIIDADCRLGDSAIGQLTTACVSTSRPVQARYVMSAPAKSVINYQVAEFAWRVKNWLRPLGLHALKLPCQLMGTGMAFPWDVINSIELGGGRIVEDLWLGLELASGGHPPVFCPSAIIMSQFASSIEGATTQRRRWEHGHIDTILKMAPALAARAILNRNWNLLALTLDLVVPPLSLLAILLLASSILTAVLLFISQSLTTFVISTACLSAFALAVLLAWLECGRDLLPDGGLFLIGHYVIRKLGLYRPLISGRLDTRWKRTDRTTPE
jgi:cellulose synthase/poly-beta-1,6-N-acetylglucosamine synthase-like glycosyltransferase